MIMDILLRFEIGTKENPFLFKGMFVKHDIGHFFLVPAYIFFIWPLVFDVGAVENQEFIS